MVCRRIVPLSNVFLFLLMPIRVGGLRSMGRRVLAGQRSVGTRVPAGQCGDNCSGWDGGYQQASEGVRRRVPTGQRGVGRKIPAGQRRGYGKKGTGRPAGV